MPPLIKDLIGPFTLASAYLNSKLSVPVTMKGDEMEMTKEELQKWIEKKVKKNKLIVAEVEKCNLLRSLLKRRENQAIHLRQLRR